jgi:hypothetical protein
MTRRRDIIIAVKLMVQFPDCFVPRNDYARGAIIAIGFMTQLIDARKLVQESIPGIAMKLALINKSLELLDVANAVYAFQPILKPCPQVINN